MWGALRARWRCAWPPVHVPQSPALSSPWCGTDSRWINCPPSANWSLYLIWHTPMMWTWCGVFLPSPLFSRQHVYCRRCRHHFLFFFGALWAVPFQVSNTIIYPPKSNTYSLTQEQPDENGTTYCNTHGEISNTNNNSTTCKIPGPKQKATSTMANKMGDNTNIFNDQNIRCQR